MAMEASAGRDIPFQSERGSAGKIEIDPESGAGYLKVGDRPVAYSLDLDDGAVADYDESGNVVGLEFLEAKKSKEEVQDYLNLAKRSTRGPATSKRPTPPSA